jgi:iron complex outermembrane receptor protein
MIYKKLASALACGVCIVAMATPANAQTRAYNIPGGSLKSALDAYGRQSGRPVIYRTDDVRSAHSRGVRGNLSSDEALKRLLDGSGFTYRIDSSGAVAIIAEAASTSSAAKNEDITVTGTRLKQAVNGFPLNSYSREKIETSGQPNLGAYLSTLNEVSVVTPSAGPFSSTNNNATVQLRGLPVGTTLTLLNGRRLQSFGSSSGALIFDINSIPFEAIERVDVVPVGSSAIYGGDALAGVVNIVLKRSIEGLSISGNYGFGAGTQDGSLSFATGHRFDRGSVLLVGSVGKTTPLTTTDRNFFRNADYRRFGGADARVDTCLPGTVSSASTSNLPGLSSTLAGIPDRATETKPAISDFAATAGSPNLCGGFGTGNGSSLINESKRYALHLAGEYEAADWLTIFGEGTYNREQIEILFYPITLRSVLVPATNAFNPFGVDVSVTTQLGVNNGYSGRTRTTDFKRFLVGGRGQLAKGWDYEVTAMTARDNSESQEHGELLDSTALTVALASSDPATALNLFTTGRAASDQVLRAIWGDIAARKGAGQHDQVNAFVRGAFGGLPAGQIQVVAGGEASRDIFKTSGTGYSYDTRRTSVAGFAEANIPLLAKSGGGKLVSLSLAGRWDSFSDFRDATTYQAGIEFEPAENLHLRLATSTSFKPPSLLDLNPSPATYTTELFGLHDPKRGNEPVIGGAVVFGPNPSLAPETGKASTFGIAWEPGMVPHLRLGATFWSVKINNLVTLLYPQTALDYEELFSSSVTRQPSVGGVPGKVTQVDLQYVNFGSIQATGIDFEASYVQRTSLGSFTIAGSATRTTKYDAILVPGAATENRLGVRTDDFWSPKWKARASVQLDSGQWQLGITGRYVGNYLDSSTSTLRLGNRWTYDISARVNIAKRAQLSASIVNVGNQLPQFSAASYSAYDATQGDWRGRYINLRLSTRW